MSTPPSVQPTDAFLVFENNPTDSVIRAVLKDVHVCPGAPTKPGRVVAVIHTNPLTARRLVFGNEPTLDSAT